METANPPAMSVKDWVIALLITAIPLVGFVMLIVWAFSSTENPNKANWAKATLIIMAISIVLVFLFWSTIAALFMANTLAR